MRAWRQCVRVRDVVAGTAEKYRLPVNLNVSRVGAAALIAASTLVLNLSSASTSSCSMSVMQSPYAADSSGLVVMLRVRHVVINCIARSFCSAFISSPHFLEFIFAAKRAISSFRSLPR